MPGDSTSAGDGVGRLPSRRTMVDKAGHGARGGVPAEGAASPEERGSCGVFREQLPITAACGGVRALCPQARPHLLTGKMGLAAKKGAAPVLWPISKSLSDLCKS